MKRTLHVTACHDAMVEFQVLPRDDFPLFSGVQPK